MDIFNCEKIPVMGIAFYVFFTIYIINSRIGFLYGIISQKIKDLYYGTDTYGYRRISSGGTFV